MNNNQTNKKEQEIIKQKIKRINEIFEEFLKEIEPLKKKQNELIRQILERVDQEKIKKIEEALKKLKKQE